MPEPEFTSEDGRFSGYQHFPATAPTEAQPNPPKTKDDRNFALYGVLAGGWTAEALATAPRPAPRARAPAAPLRRHALHAARCAGQRRPRPGRSRTACPRFRRPNCAHQSAAEWARFWSASAVELADRELEEIWYRNQYFLACCLKPGKVAPGLFGNWSSGKIGTAWHGDYHMNYNTQQVWWGVFSSNHAEQHEPYTRLVESLMPMAEWNARVQFGLPGAYFPHSAYPVPSSVNPYPAPPWGYEICETPWTVQSLWWQYRYTLDPQYLRARLSHPARGR